MNTNNKVIICDSTAEGMKTACKICEYGMSAYARNYDKSSIIKSIIKDQPDAVIMKADSRIEEKIEFIRNISSVIPEPPEFILAYDEEYSIMGYFVSELGFNCCLYSAESIFECISSIFGNYAERSGIIIDAEIADILKSLNMPAHVKGYKYLKSAVLSCYGDSSFLDGITKNLYPKIAEEYSTTPVRVERNIRNVISLAWNKNPECFRDNISYYLNRKPTNLEFITLVTETLGFRKNLKFSENRAKNIKNISSGRFSPASAMVNF